VSRYRCKACRAVLEPAEVREGPCNDPRLSIPKWHPVKIGLGADACGPVVLWRAERDAMLQRRRMRRRREEGRG
jgi:hypothetical protein